MCESMYNVYPELTFFFLIIYLISLLASFPQTPSYIYQTLKRPFLYGTFICLSFVRALSFYEKMCKYFIYILDYIDF